VGEGLGGADKEPAKVRERAPLPLPLAQREPPPESEGEGVPERDSAGERVGEGVWEAESEGRPLALACALAEGDGDGRGEGEGEPLREGEPLGEGDCEALRLGPREALPLALPLAREVGEGATAVALPAAVAVCSRGVGVAGALREALPPLGVAQRVAAGEGDAVRVPAAGLAEALPRGEREREAEPDGVRLARAEAHAEALPVALPPPPPSAAAGEGVGVAEGSPEGVAAAERVAEGARRTREAFSDPPRRCATARTSGSGAPAGSGSAPSGAKKPPSSAAASQGSSPEEGVTVKRLASAPGPQWPLPSRGERDARAGPSIAPRGALGGAPASASCAAVRPPGGSLRAT